MTDSTSIKQPVRRIFEGIVVSDRMDKTIVVRIDSQKRHPKYGKSYRVSKKFQVHDPANQYQIGQRVQFVETRPLSRHKRWRVLSPTQSASS